MIGAETGSSIKSLEGRGGIEPSNSSSLGKLYPITTSSFACGQFVKRFISDFLSRGRLIVGGSRPIERCLALFQNPMLVRHMEIAQYDRAVVYTQDGAAMAPV